MKNDFNIIVPTKHNKNVLCELWNLRGVGSKKVPYLVKFFSAKSPLGPVISGSQPGRHGPVISDSQLGLDGPMSVELTHDLHLEKINNLTTRA